MSIATIRHNDKAFLHWETGSDRLLRLVATTDFVDGQWVTVGELGDPHKMRPYISVARKFNLHWVLDKIDDYLNSEEVSA